MYSTTSYDRWQQLRIAAAQVDSRFGNSTAYDKQGESDRFAGSVAMRVLPLVACALICQAAAAGGAPTIPDCGSIDRDIGRGFILTQRMYGGTRDFELGFQASAIRTRGVRVANPFQLTIVSFDDSFDVGIGETTVGNGPHIGLHYAGVSGPDGKDYTGTLKLDCGAGTVLRFRTVLSAPNPPALNEFPAVFFGQPEQRCLRELMQTGHLNFSVAEPEGSPPRIQVNSPYPLSWAIERMKTIWAEQVQDAKDGRCHMRPPLAPPF